MCIIGSLYLIPFTVQVMTTWTGHLVDIREKRNAYRDLWLRNMKEITQNNQCDNIKMDLKKVGWGAWTGFI